MEILLEVLAFPLFILGFIGFAVFAGWLFKKIQEEDEGGLREGDSSGGY